MAYKNKALYDALKTVRENLYNKYNSLAPETLVNALHISRGNAKTGAIPAFSMLPVVTCAGNACPGCYAVKNALCHGCNIAANTCLRAWSENTAILFQCQRTGRFKPFFVHMSDYIRRTQPAFFRIHVSGDFFSKKYFLCWCAIAAACPGTRFLAFTKAYGNVSHVIPPDNFQLVVSGWPGVEIPEDVAEKFPVAFLDVPGYSEDMEIRRAAALLCPGHCETCGACWNLSAVGRDVKFHKH